MKLSIDLIVADESTQMRAGTRNETIEEYADLFETSNKRWPFDSAIVVFYDDKYYLADGWHRYLAAIRANRASVECDVREGTLEDAQDYALGANVSHGLRRTNDDKRKAVEKALRMDRHVKKSDRAIAGLCGVSQPFVGQIRKQLISVINSPDTRTGIDGKEYPAARKAKQDPPKQELPSDDPKPKPKPKPGAPVVHEPWKQIAQQAINEAGALMRRIDRLSESIGSRGENFKNAHASLAVVLKAVRGMEKGNA